MMVSKEKKKKFNDGDKVVTCVGDNWLRGKVTKAEFFERPPYGSGYIGMWYYEIDSHPHKWLPEIELLPNISRGAKCEGAEARLRTREA